MMRRRSFLGSALALVAARVTQSADSPRAVTDVMSFGAKGDGSTKDTLAIQKAIDACAAAGGGCVYLPAGRTYLSGNIQLRPHIEVFLESGATLKGSGDSQDFAEFGALLFAKDAENISVTGGGVIDGNFPAYLHTMQEGGFQVTFPFLGPYDPLSKPGEKDSVHGRPRMILLLGCRNIHLRQFTIRNAPTWTVHPIGCQDLLIDGITILNDLRVPNCDGIDIDHCRNVRIANCNIQAGDDCIVLKTSRNFTGRGPCENVTVTGCTLLSSSAAVKFEPEGPEPIRNIVITGCTIQRSNRGICILNRDGSLIENIICSDLAIETELRAPMWWGAGEPVHISNLPRNAQTSVGPVRRLRFSNLICRGESGLFLYGGPDSPVEDVVFDNLEVLVERTSQREGGYYDLRPGNLSQGLYRHKIAGIYCEKVDDLAFLNTKVKWGANLPAYYGAGLEAHNVTGLELSRFKATGAHSGTDRDQIIDNGRAAQ